MMTTALTCPECEDRLQISPAARVNEIIECPGCRRELEIVALDPVMLAIAPEIEEDWGE